MLSTEGSTQVQEKGMLSADDMAYVQEKILFTEDSIRVRANVMYI